MKTFAGVVVTGSERVAPAFFTVSLPKFAASRAAWGATERNKGTRL